MCADAPESIKNSLGIHIKLYLMWCMVGCLHRRHARIGELADGRFGWTEEGKESFGDTMASQRGVDSGDAPINSWKCKELGISYPSVGPGGMPWRLDSTQHHEETLEPNTHVDISLPR